MALDLARAQAAIRARTALLGALDAAGQSLEEERRRKKASLLGTAHKETRLPGFTKAYIAPDAGSVLPPRMQKSRALHAAAVLAGVPDTPAPAPGGWMHGAISSEARVLTPQGPRLAKDLSAGMRISTKDSPPQPILWIGRRALTTAQLASRPALCPVRIKPGALGPEFPRRMVEVSPAEHLVMQSQEETPDNAAAPGDEFLVAAAALTRREGICRALPRSGFTYVQILLPRHAVIFVEGVEMESFHPGSLRPRNADRQVWAELLGVMPDLEHGLEFYGPLARPRLTTRSAA